MPDLDQSHEPEKSGAELAIEGTFGCFETSAHPKRNEPRAGLMVSDDIDKANQFFVKEKLGTQLTDKLYAGIDRYKSKKKEAVESYLEKNEKLTNSDPNSPIYFRNELIAYIKKLKIEPYPDPNKDWKLGQDKNADLRESQPEKEAITIKKLLGDKGVALYKLALYEERYSEKYVDAVFVKSTVPVAGEQWDGKRPIVIVAGPSGCGKSHAAAAALKQTSYFIPTVEGSPTDSNFAVFADGGIERDLSQIRKIAIQLALNNGYTGVSDLEQTSKLEHKVKTCVFNAVVGSNNLGLVMPETFVGTGVKKVIELQKKPNTVVVFSRVEGENPDTFKDVVAFLGARRAFKASNFDKVSTSELYLNITGLPESKVYDSMGFFWGNYGSMVAEKAFTESKPDSLSMIITNDLTLRKYDNGTWSYGKLGESGVVVVSNRVFQKWQQLSESQQLAEGAAKCCGKGDKQITPEQWRALSKVEQLNKALEKYNAEHGKSIIHTRGQMDLLILKIQMGKDIADLQQLNNPSPKHDLLRVGLERVLTTIPEHLSEGGLKIDSQEIKKMHDAIDVYRDDLGLERAKKLDAAMGRLSSEAKLRTFNAVLEPAEKTVNNKQQAILTDVRSFSEFKTAKLNINAVEYKDVSASTSTVPNATRVKLAQVKAQEVYYQGYHLKDDERIVSQMSVVNGHARLEQTKSGSVEDRCSGTLTTLESQLVALKQAQMALNNYDPEKGKIILHGKDVAQAQRVYAAVMYLALNDPELKIKMKSGMFSSDPAQLIHCRVLGFTFPGTLERNSSFINRHLPDLKDIIRTNSTDGVNVLSSSDKKKIDLELKTQKNEADTTHPFRVFKEKFKISVQSAEESSEKPGMKGMK